MLFSIKLILILDFQSVLPIRIYIKYNSSLRNRKFKYIKYSNRCDYQINFVKKYLKIYK